MLMETISRWIGGVNDVLWTYVLVAALLGCAVWFTLRTRGVQFRLLGEMMRVLGESAGSGPEGERHVSSFQAFAVSLASRVGTGNLAGVATAIVVGGPGAVFWMWVIAFLGMATIYAEATLAQETRTVDKDGNVPNMDRAMLADACATCAGAVCGTSTVTTFVESSAGVAEGGRTGLASMATAVMFFIAMFLSPVAQLIPTYACAAALIYVGVLMMSNVRNINWDDPAAAVTGFVTVAFMPLTYNISYGIAFGLISYVFVKIFTGKIKDINVGTWIISILFALMFFLTR